MTRPLPFTPAALIAVAVAAITMVAGYFAFVLPRSREVANLERQIAASAPLGAAAAIEPISDEERVRWAELQALVQSRFVSPEEQLRLMVQAGRVAGASGLVVTGLTLEEAAVAATPAGEGAAAESPFVPPGMLAPNAGVIRLTARHRYGDLVDFLDRLGRGATYVALRSADIRRVDGHLESELRLSSLRWTEPE